MDPRSNFMEANVNSLPISGISTASNAEPISRKASRVESLIQECNVSNCPLYSSQDATLECSSSSQVAANTNPGNSVATPAEEGALPKTPDDSETCSESLSSDSAGIYSAVDFVTSMGRLLKSCESSEANRFPENNSCSASLASEGFSLPSTLPPDDSDRPIFSTPGHLHDHTVSQSLLTTVKKLEAKVESLTESLARLAFNNQVNVFRDTSRDEQVRAQREKCVVLKCIPESHLSGELLERISNYFQIPRQSLQLHVMDRYKGWCVVLIRTPSRHHATLILHNFADFRQSCEHYHRTQALQSYSRAEQLLHQELWAEAIKRNNRAGLRLWEVKDLKLVEVEGEPKPWHVKVHYFPDEESANAPISANDVRKKQRQNAANPSVSKPSTSNVGIQKLPMTTSTPLTSPLLSSSNSSFKTFDVESTWLNSRQSFGSLFKPPRSDRLFGRNGFRDARKKSINSSILSYLEQNNVRSKFECFGDQNNNFMPSSNGSCRCSPLPCAKSCLYNCQCSQRSSCHDSSQSCQQRCCNKSTQPVPNFNPAPGPGPSTNNWYDYYQSSSPTPIYNFGASPYVASPGPQYSYAMQPVMQYTTSVPQQQAPCQVVPVAPVQNPQSASQTMASVDAEKVQNPSTFG